MISIISKELIEAWDENIRVDKYIIEIMDSAKKMVELMKDLPKDSKKMTMRTGRIEVTIELLDED